MVVVAEAEAAEEVAGAGNGGGTQVCCTVCLLLVCILKACEAVRIRRRGEELKEGLCVCTEWRAQKLAEMGAGRDKGPRAEMTQVNSALGSDTL